MNRIRRYGKALKDTMYKAIVSAHSVFLVYMDICRQTKKNGLEIQNSWHTLLNQLPNCLVLPAAVMNSCRTFKPTSEAAISNPLQIFESSRHFNFFTNWSLDGVYLAAQQPSRAGGRFGSASAAALRLTTTRRHGSSWLWPARACALVASGVRPLFGETYYFDRRCQFLLEFVW